MTPEHFILTEAEEKAMIGILYNHLSFATTMEMFGELGDHGVARVEQLRTVITKLLRKYDLVESLPADTFLLLGLTDFLPPEELLRWSQMDENKHMQNRAKFFMNK